jgi:hypothetical protein
MALSSWWQLGEGYGHRGNELPLYQITCPFCLEKGNFTVACHHEKKKPNSKKSLNFDTLKCGNCAGYVMALWSESAEFGGGGLIGYRVLPWPIAKPEPREHWPAEIKRLWPQAHSSLQQENWDAAVVIARSALQAALRDYKAEGKSLFDEVSNLAAKGLLPPVMKEWANELRVLGNESAHPEVGKTGPTARDAKDAIEFLDFLIQYLYDLPKQINEYRARKANTD